MDPTTLVLFDIDGTLMSCRGRGLRAMHAAMQLAFGLAPAELHTRPHGKTDPMLFDEMAQAYRLPASRLAERRHELEVIYATELEILLRERGACELEPGVHDLLAALAARPDVALGVVSGNLERTAWLKLEAAGLSAYFETGAFGSDARERGHLVGLALERCAARCGAAFAPQHAWVVGDTPDDVAAGKAHGTRTVAVATGMFSALELLPSGADAVLEDFADTRQVLDILCRRDGR